MALFNEDEPKKPAGWTLSIDELVERVALLRAEIERVEAAIEAKRASIGVADTFFKS